MTGLRLMVYRLKGRSCDSCAFAETFRSNGDGQVTRLHTFCRARQSSYCDRPVPQERLCEHWRKADRPPDRPQVGDPNLTA
jgi:hypothetical protein